MHVYKFRLTLDDSEEFIRDIEMESKHTFEDFHKTIIDAVGFDGSQLASFFVADNSWRKQKEITLLDMADPDLEIESGDIQTEMMRNTRLCDFIEDPHQRFIYVYDYLKLWSFYIELLKVQPSEKNIKYPRCVKNIGVLPKKMTLTSIIPPIDEENSSIIGPDDFIEVADSEEEEEDTIDEYSEDSPELSDGFEELKF